MDMGLADCSIKLKNLLEPVNSGLVSRKNYKNLHENISFLRLGIKECKKWFLYSYD